MSFSFGFYNALNHDRLYDAIQVSEIFDGLILDGVYSTIGDHYVVKASENENEVIVGSGRAWFDHTWNKNDADLPITAPLPDLLMKRYDALVIDINANVASRTNQITWVEGTPSLNTPVKPTLINTTDHHQYPLCYILRTANNNTIIQDDIENTIGTDECPFVTGILQQVSISDLLLQWTSQFATFMNNNEATASAWEAEWEASMNAWTVEQKNEFATWMAGEKTEFDDWFANLHYILDGDVAGHLQNEIDAIEEGLGGSVFTIHTINSSLYGKTVTCTGSTQEKTAVFDASGNAEIKGITDVGTITFTATDGSQTAVTQISVPYFSNYPITMAFWAATVNLSTTSEDLKSKTITIRKGGAVVASTSFNAAGTATYIATSAGTYTFTCQGYSVEQAITEETTYNVSINSGLDLSAWITAGSTTDYPLNPSSYANFAALEADEEAIRQLMLVHNAVDYLATAGADDALIENVINSDICAKWINLSDYALDTLSANTNIKSVMDEADKYGYGEWAICKNLVPIMTSNTTPSGEAIRSSAESSALEAWKAFNGTHTDNADRWNAAQGTTAWIGYHFTEPVEIRGAEADVANNNLSGILQYSDDGTNWNDTDGTFTNANMYYFVTCSKYGKHEYWRVSLTLPQAGGFGHFILKFLVYGALGNVPIMTANNAPYGTAIYSSEISQYHRAYMAFDNDTTTTWMANTNSLPASVGYTFTSPVCVKKVHISLNDSFLRTPTKFKIQASNDGFSSDIHDLSDVISTTTQPTEPISWDVLLNNDDYYLSYRMYITEVAFYTADNAPCVTSLQFYGRELTIKENLIPKMTSETTPSGKVTKSSEQSASVAAYTCVGNPMYTGGGSWYTPINTTTGWVAYEFDSATEISGFVMGHNTYNYPTNYQLLGSNDGTNWDTLGTYTNSSGTREEKSHVLPENVTYKHYKLNITASAQGSGASARYLCVEEFNVFICKPDYSEKEFAPGSTRKTIYDHGVEFEAIQTYITGTASIVKEPNQIYGYKGNAANSGFEFGIKLDITDYDMFCIKAGTKWYHYPYLLVSTAIDASNSGQQAMSHIANTTAPYPLKSLEGICDISSVNGEYAVSLYYAEVNNAGEFWGTVKEMWLE